MSRPESINETMIVKVQIPLNRTGDKKSVLIYNKNRSLFFQDTDPQFFLTQKLVREGKDYYHSTLDEHGQITFWSQATEEEWNGQ